MASNSFGTILKITTWGESHGPAIGCVIDGFPAGVDIDEATINLALSKRRPGQNSFTSPRVESDLVEILSGVFEGKSTGAPISFQILNQNVDSSKYDAVKEVYKPGHAQFSYLQKFGIFDHRGGGRASARETAVRVAAASICEPLLRRFGIEVMGWLDKLGALSLPLSLTEPSFLSFFDDEKITQQAIDSNPLFLASSEDSPLTQSAIDYLNQIKANQNSVGGIVGFYIKNVPKGLGEPVYDKMEARLAQAMLSIPASKGFEIGAGFMMSEMLGTESNDTFCLDGNQIKTKTNHAGGILGGISNGMPIYGRVAFKPTSSHLQKSESVSIDRKVADFQVPQGSKHDPCVAIRAVPIVRAMAILCITDFLLINQARTLCNIKI